MLIMLEYISIDFGLPAVKADPSKMLEVSRNGLSVPLTS